MRCKAGPGFSRWPHFIPGIELGLWVMETEASDCAEARWRGPGHSWVGFPPSKPHHAHPPGTQTVPLCPSQNLHRHTCPPPQQSIARISSHSSFPKHAQAPPVKTKSSSLRNDPVGSSQALCSPLPTVARNKCARTDSHSSQTRLFLNKKNYKVMRTKYEWRSCFQS